MINLLNLKKIFIFCLIGSLITAALMAVITIITGDFNEVTGRVLMTLLMVVVHSLVSLMFIWSDEKKNLLEKLNFSIDVLFILIVISFITSILGVWKIIDGETVYQLYLIYFVLFFSSLQADMLSKALRKEKYLDIVIYTNYLFIIILALMLLPVIYYINDGLLILGEMFFRLMGAVAIIDGTLSILTIIFYRLYIHRHPEARIQDNGQSRKGCSVWIWILILFFIAPSMLRALLEFYKDTNPQVTNTNRQNTAAANTVKKVDFQAANNNETPNKNSATQVIDANRQNTAADNIIKKVDLQAANDNETPVCGPTYGTCAVGTASAITKQCDTGGCDWCALNNYYNSVYDTTGCTRIITNTDPTNCACMCEYYTCSE